jgi:hypothetical protein
MMSMGVNNAGSYSIGLQNFLPELLDWFKKKERQRQACLGDEGFSYVLSGEILTQR